MSSQLRSQRFSEDAGQVFQGKVLNQVSVMADSPYILRYKLENKPIEVIYEEAVVGLVAYGQSHNCREQAVQLSNELLKAVLTGDANTVGECAIRLYTKQTFLYRTVNRYLRNADFKDVGSVDFIALDTKEQANELLPYCFILNSYVKDKGNSSYAGTVYRGANLSTQQIQQYTNSIGKLHQWNAFSSTTKNRKQAEKFGNVLFMIKLGEQGVGYGHEFGLQIQKYSHYPKEEEVLLFAGKQIQVIEVKFRNNKYYIKLVCTDYGP